MYLVGEFLAKYIPSLGDICKCQDFLGFFATHFFTNSRYKALDARLIGTSPQIVVAKALIDQAVSSPIILVVFFTGMSAMEGRADWFKELKEKFVKSYTFSCLFWLPAQCLNFFLVPNAFRVVYVGSASFLWVNVLCLLKRGNSGTEEEKKD